MTTFVADLVSRDDGTVAKLKAQSTGVGAERHQNQLSQISCVDGPTVWCWQNMSKIICQQSFRTSPHGFGCDTAAFERFHPQRTYTRGEM